jgi:hypothetical protein
LSVQTGIAPDHLARLDWDDLDALAIAVTERWGHVEELLATAVELLDSFRLMWARANSEESARIPEPIAYPRPGAALLKTPEPARMSFREFGRKWKGGKHGP